MAGSLKFFLYDDDQGGTWAMNRDESNIENVVVDDATVDITLTNVVDRRYQIPRNLRPRYAVFREVGGLATRKVTIPTPAIYNALVTGDTLVALRSFSEGGIQFQLQSVVPERITPVVVDIDTGITDGDVD